LAPGGFHRRFTARALAFSASLVRVGNDVELTVSSFMTHPMRVLVEDLSYGQPHQGIDLQPGQSTRAALDLSDSRNWYDLQLSCQGQVLRMAGHIETGADGVSDPAAHGAARLHFESAAMILDRA